jgi:hypothetical protein
MGSGLAIYMLVMSQHGTLDATVRSELTRSSLRRGVAFRLQRADHGQFVLSDWHQVDASKLDLPGMCYYQDGPHTASIPMRTPEIPHALAEQIAARNGKLPRRPLMLFARDCQDVYDGRWGRLPETFRDLAPQYAAWLASLQATAQAVQEVPVTVARQSPADDYTEESSSSPAAVAARIEREIAGTPDTPPPHIPSDVIRSETASRKRRFCHELATAGPEGIGPTRLAKLSGMSPSWIHMRLPVLCLKGVVTRDDSGPKATYRGTSETGIWDTLEGIKAQQDQLLASVAS